MSGKRRSEQVEKRRALLSPREREVVEEMEAETRLQDAALEYRRTRDYVTERVRREAESELLEAALAYAETVEPR